MEDDRSEFTEVIYNLRSQTGRFTQRLGCSDSTSQRAGVEAIKRGGGQTLYKLPGLSRPSRSQGRFSLGAQQHIESTSAEPRIAWGIIQVGIEFTMRVTNEIDLHSFLPC